MNEPLKQVINETLKLNLNVLPVINFAFQQNKIPVVQKAELVNSGSEDLVDLVLRIESVPKELCLPLEQQLDGIPAGTSLDLTEFQPILNTDYMVALPEKIVSALQFTICKGEEVLTDTTCEVEALPANQWHGSGSYRELLAAFVTPNHGLIPSILHRASELLLERTGDAGLKAYFKDANRVLQTAAAIYDAICEREIAYAVAPASFELSGQRIRLVDEVLRKKLGNCMETTLLYAGCLEAAGLNPLLILQPTHIFTGIWLEDKTFPEAVSTDASLIIKRLDEGVREIVLVESTLMCAGKDCSFDGARQVAQQEIMECMEYFVDVTAARRRPGITPLPICPNDDEDMTFSIRDSKPTLRTAAPDELADAIPDEADAITYTRLQQWERHLLNLDLRNPLLSLGFGRVTTLPLCCGSMKDLVAALASEDDFTIHPMEKGKLVDFEAMSRYSEDDSDDLRQCRLRSPLEMNELLKRAKKLRGLAKTSIEEKGGNTLFLTVGMMRWHEEPGSAPRYAPILLYPVDMIISGSGCKLRLREEEVQLNVTLVEKLKQDFRIAFPSWETLPTCSDGTVDVAKVMATMRSCVREQPHWNVIKGAYISNFSFTQFVLWKDLKEHPQVLTDSTLVSSLLDGHLKWKPDDARFTARTPGDTLSLPIPVDASQLFAIESAVQGETFVLHGPPGTGKSQTITAAIAAALRAGKKIIFVTEKLAGLTVVQKRLEEIGLAPFCLELHSNKARKQDVLRHFNEILELAENTVTKNGASDPQKVEQVKEQLDAYAEALHRAGNCGMSLYQLVTRYQQLEDGVSFASEIFPEPRSITAQELAKQEAMLDRLILMREALGNPSTHALCNVHHKNYSQQYKQQLNRAIDDYAAALEQIDASARALAKTYDLQSDCSSFGELENLYELSRHLETWSHMPKQWNSVEKLERTLDPLKKLSELCIRVNSLRTQILGSWHKEFLTLPGQELLNEFRAGTEGPVLMRQLSLRKLNRKLLPLQKVGIPPENYGEHLTALANYQSMHTQAMQLKEANHKSLQAYFGEAPYRWGDIAKTVDDAQRTAACFRVMTNSDNDDFRRSYAAGEPAPEAEAMGKAWQNVLEKRKNIYGLLGIEIPKGGDGWLTGEQGYCTQLRDQIDMLKEWTAWNALCHEAREQGMGSAVNACYTDADPRQIRNGYLKGLYSRIIGDVIDRESALSDFTGLVFNEQIENLRRMDQQLQTQTRKDIYNTILGRISDTVAAIKVENAQLSALKKAISSGGRGTTVRKLFAEHTDLLLELCPCLLMSPLSVAQYLPMRNDLVDLVIFDEASQIPTSKAVGTLARGKSAMVVGDVNQMPPTSFFNSITVDEDNLDTEDLESILDDCLALNVPGTSLTWHYRSRHESLIAFSNAHFYDNKLLTFPSARDRNSHVRLQLVENGVFERGKGRRNPLEAKAVIEQLQSMSRDEAYRDMSVGIITFNIEQQELIEEQLREACRSDETLSAWCARSTEPLFVKNLENVQGDERDVILFSVGYGPDAAGKVSMNFGPLNKEGGWRRLNVAVSRARHEMKVFTSLHPEQIDLKRSSARGVKALKDFLEYASGSPLPTQRQRSGDAVSASGIRSELCRILQEAGYETVCNVGCSDLRVDVAVVHPEHPEQYILGILLDGEAYAAAKTTRDRELSHVDVLKGLGWDIHRIWTVDWWDNSRKETTALLKKLKSMT